MAGKRIKHYDRTKWNDIRYRGPLSYRHLMIIAWICISCTVLTIMINFGIRLDPRQPKWIYALGEYAGYASNFSLPIFLIANFAILLDKKFTYKVQLMKFGGLSAVVVFLFLLFKEHYIVGIVSTVLQDHNAAEQLVNSILFDLSRGGKLSFNLFIDMFLCTLLMFFLNYVPKKVFTGRKLILFRLFALIPILYEVGCLVLRVLMALDKITPYYLVYPLMTTKPLMSFVLFVILALHIRFQEKRFLKKGKTSEEYAQYTETNAHSLHFSIFASIMIFVTGIIDVILYIIGAAAMLLPGMAAAETETEAMIEQAVAVQATAGQALEAQVPAAMATVEAWGIGKHMGMMAIIPIILLFSYTRNHKNTTADMAIPVGGFILALFTFLESLYWGIVMNLPIIMRNIQSMVEEMLS